MGNVFNNIANSTIINKADVSNSFNKIAQEYDKEVANALLAIAEEIEKSKNGEAGALFNSFTTELQKNNPSKTVLKTLWGGVVSQLPNISAMVGVVEKTVRLFE